MRNIKKIRQLLLFLAPVVLAAAFFLKSGTETSPPQGKDAGEEKSSVDLSLRKVLYTEVENGVTKWRLRAEKGDVDRDGGKVFLTAPHLVTSPDNRDRKLDITAATAEYDMNRKEIDLAGGVRAVDSAGVVFTTPKAKFMIARSLITSSDRVTFSHRGTELEGEGLEARTDIESLKILGKVKARIGREK